MRIASTSHDPVVRRSLVLAQCVKKPQVRGQGCRPLFVALHAVTGRPHWAQPAGTTLHRTPVNRGRRVLQAMPRGGEMGSSKPKLAGPHVFVAVSSYLWASRTTLARTQARAAIMGARPSYKNNGHLSSFERFEVNKRSLTHPVTQSFSPSRLPLNRVMYLHAFTTFFRSWVGRRYFRLSSVHLYRYRADAELLRAK